MIESKCKTCTDRYVGCHSNCEHYKEFVEKNRKVRLNRDASNRHYGVDRTAKTKHVPSVIKGKGRKWH